LSGQGMKGAGSPGEHAGSPGGTPGREHRTAGAKQGEDEPEVGFEQALGRLEGLVDRLETGELPLEETIQTFEEGQKLLRLCSRLLDTAEQRVQEILREADGSLSLRERKGDADAGL